MLHCKMKNVHYFLNEEFERSKNCRATWNAQARIFVLKFSFCLYFQPWESSYRAIELHAAPADPI